MTHSWSLQCLQFLSLIRWSLSYLIFFCYYFISHFQNINQHKSQNKQKQTVSDVFQKKQLIQANMHFTEHHRIEHQKLELMRVYKSGSSLVQSGPRKVFQEGFPDTQKRIFWVFAELFYLYYGQHVCYPQLKDTTFPRHIWFLNTNMRTVQTLRSML